MQTHQPAVAHTVVDIGSDDRGLAILVSALDVLFDDMQRGVPINGFLHRADPDSRCRRTPEDIGPTLHDCLDTGQ